MTSELSSVVLDAVSVIYSIEALQKQVIFLNRRFFIGRKEQYISTHLDRASGRLHESVLWKFSAALFSALPSIHPLSPSSGCNESTKIALACRLDDSSDIYSSSEYGQAGKSACSKVLTEIRSARSRALRDLLEHCYDCNVPDLPDLSTMKVSLYLLGFVILKVSLSPPVFLKQFISNISSLLL